MSALPARASVVVIGAGIVGNSMAYHLAKARLARHRADREGHAPEPRRLDRPRLELHLPDRPLEGDDGVHARQRPPVPRARRVHARRGGIEVARTPERMEELKRRMASSTSWGDRGHPTADPGRGQGDGPVHRRDRHPRRLLHAGRRRRRLAPGRHAHAPGGAGAGRADDRRRRRGHRASTSRTGTSARVRTDAGRHRGRRRRHRLRRLEPADRADGRRVDPAHAGRPPDDRHRAGAAVRAHDRARSASRSSATWTRTCTSASTAAASRSARTPTGRSSWTPTTSRRSRRPRCRRRCCRSRQEDFDPQLEDALELFPEIVGDESVGREAGDQRPAVAHPGRQPDHRRDARGQGPLVGGGDLDQGGARDRQDASPSG